MANLEITVEMAEFTREMYNELKESGYINDESVIIQMSHEVGKELSDILEREPSVEELAEEMKTTVEKIIELQRVAQDSISFDNAVGDEEDSTLIDLVADDNTLNPLEYTEKTLGFTVCPITKT